MSVTAAFDLKLNITETVPAGSELATAPSPTTKTVYAGSTGELSATTTPVVSAQYSKRFTLTAGALTIDLTALVETAVVGTVNKTFSGLKVHLFKIAADPVNTDELVFKKGAANGYPLFGEVGANVGIEVLDIGEQIVRNCNGRRPAVSGTVKTIDVTCAGDADAAFEIQLVAGA